MPKQTVNPWRRLFIVNEFNELMTSRTINSELLLLIFLVIAEGFGFKYYSLMEADLTRYETKSPENYALNFVIIVTIVYAIGCSTYFAGMLVTPFYPHDYVEFVDLCSIANISVIMFNEDLNGHYIHGKSPSGAADVSSERLRLNLENER